jgi:glycosyltransferase involved in cell wall biosynthesis
MEENVKVSIAVPCYEMHDKGGIFLEKLLTTINNQTYKNIEIVISDHSINDLVKDVADKWTSLNIKYIRNENGRGLSSQNINNAIRHCSGDIIKPLFQDDFLYNDICIEKIVTDFYPSESMWGASACNCTDENESHFFYEWFPSYKGHEPTGNNKIGAPSLIFFRNNKIDFFDETLIWLMDCEFYYRLFQRYGEPLIFNDIFITIRRWDKAVTNTLATKEVRKKEAQYVITKHNL